MQDNYVLLYYILDNYADCSFPICQLSSNLKILKVAFLKCLKLILYLSFVFNGLSINGPSKEQK